MRSLVPEAVDSGRCRFPLQVIDPGPASIMSLERERDRIARAPRKFSLFRLPGFRGKELASDYNSAFFACNNAVESELAIP